MKIITTIILTIGLSLGLMSQNHSNEIWKFYQNLDKGDYAGIDNMISNNFAAIVPFSEVNLSKSEWINYCKDMRTIFPNLQYILSDFHAESNTASVAGVWTGNHSGTFMDVPPTGCEISAKFNSIFTLDQKGKIVQIQFNYDPTLIANQFADCKNEKIKSSSSN